MLRQQFDQALFGLDARGRLFDKRHLGALDISPCQILWIIDRHVSAPLAREDFVVRGKLCRQVALSVALVRKVWPIAADDPIPVEPARRVAAVTAVIPVMA